MEKTKQEYYNPKNQPYSWYYWDGFVVGLRAGIIIMVIAILVFGK